MCGSNARRMPTYCLPFLSSTITFLSRDRLSASKGRVSIRRLERGHYLNISNRVPEDLLTGRKSFRRDG